MTLEEIERAERRQAAFAGMVNRATVEDDADADWAGARRSVVADIDESLARRKNSPAAGQAAFYSNGTHWALIDAITMARAVTHAQSKMLRMLSDRIADLEHRLGPDAAKEADAEIVHKAAPTSIVIENILGLEAA